MLPHPRLCLVSTAAPDWKGPCSAILSLDTPDQEMIEWARQADTALIAPFANAALRKGVDGAWMSDATALKQVRKQIPDAQLVGLAQDRHSAMVMGEVGADLIVFGTFMPMEIGDLDLARWWAGLFVVPCACLISKDTPTEGFGQPGEPEFYIQT